VDGDVEIEGFATGTIGVGAVELATGALGAAPGKFALIPNVVAAIAKELMRAKKKLIVLCLAPFGCGAVA
jgi:hypothetical protein